MKVKTALPFIVATIMLTAMLTGCTGSINTSSTNDSNITDASTTDTTTNKTDSVKLEMTDTDKGFACVVSAEGNVYWQVGKDSCDDLMELYSLKTDESCIGIHVVPDNSEEYPYLYPDEPWTMLVYNAESPSWFTAEMEEAVWSAFEEWKNTVYSIFDYKALLELKTNDTIAAAPADNYVPTEEDIEAFMGYALDTNSLVTFMRSSVLNTIQAAVGQSVSSDAYNYIQKIRSELNTQDMIVGILTPFNVSSAGVIQSNFYAAIVGSFFDVDKWVYYAGVAEGYPYVSAVYMWNHGMVPSQDSDTVWRLHSANGGQILYTLQDEVVSTKNAFAAIVGKDGTVYWKTGMDNVDLIRDSFGLTDGEYVEVQVKPVLDKESAALVLQDGYNPDATIIFPYLDEKSVWTIFVLNEDTPEWYGTDQERAVMAACDEWKKDVYSGFDFESAGTAFTEETRKVTEYTDEDITLLTEWVDAWHNVSDKGVSPTAAIVLSGYESVSSNLWDDFDSYLLSCWRAKHTECPGSVVIYGYFKAQGITNEEDYDNDIRNVVGNSVSDVMEALAGYYYSNIDTWEYYDGDLTGYPFEAGAKLVLKNLVPFTDGKNWYLSSGEDASIVYQIDEASLLNKR